MISTEEAIVIHKLLITQFGGIEGVRNLEGLASALDRPFTTFDGEELYKDGVEKAAALIESLIKNHPFLDGNKRIGYVLMRLILMENGLDIEANEESKYQFVISIASGQLDFDAIKEWIHKNLKRE
ncbi:MAG: type II toxin-antitoxin system death-on-curing family toxin [Saprospiraceae bacterium]|nr:type II toxin-antitoxin system death-on-curing family toxin [Saprospiraceae bacterium]